MKAGCAFRAGAKFFSVNLQFTILEPAAAARGELGRFLSLRDPEDVPVEFSGITLFAGRHGEQNVVQSANTHRLPLRSWRDSVVV
jgi:hypothetical protein